MLHVAGSVLDPDLGDHVCLPFEGERERMLATQAFTVNGLRRRTKVVIITHADSPARTRDWLAPLVPGFADAESAGQVEILACADTHFTNGCLDPERVYAELANAKERARRHGQHGVYALVDASWGVPDAPGQAVFEAGTNELFGERWLAAVCQYDRRLFPREAIDRATSVHPISPEQALLRFANTGSPAGLRIWGDIDLTNRQAFASVLARLEKEPGEVLIDASDLDFIDAGSAQLLTVTAMARPEGSTAIVCRDSMARVLRLIRADEFIAVRRVGDV
ncbi:Anti-anti-sigma regulatory factor (antagonist of anti-sigma factor) [Nonomuraea solani]|uniref:Anti-anti-sigma regulatory factor (Antagonist of anti-sigma factor) n=1 Tax=Nonomuraea solani TaxID=1144553 RepID=A0A1H6DE45_9ACTN|nr:MEDS domain-containing protein [Nonomuraea solani]SEG83491.1 Anti-anti-sigma regulatory factor (antagonist of anti-sigma factor) [Nonomuraea solani]